MRLSDKYWWPRSKRSTYQTPTLPVNCREFLRSAAQYRMHPELIPTATLHSKSPLRWGRLGLQSNPLIRRWAVDLRLGCPAFTAMSRNSTIVSCRSLALTGPSSDRNCCSPPAFSAAELLATLIAGGALAIRRVSESWRSITNRTSSQGRTKSAYPLRWKVSPKCRQIRAHHAIRYLGPTQ